MQAESSEEFYDVSTRNKKYGRVDAMNGPVLLEKYAVATARLDESFLLIATQAYILRAKPGQDGQVHDAFVKIWHQVTRSELKHSASKAPHLYQERVDWPRLLRCLMSPQSPWSLDCKEVMQALQRRGVGLYHP